MKNRRFSLKLKSSLIIAGLAIFLYVSEYSTANNKLDEPSKPSTAETIEKANISITKKELDSVAEKIFKNEAGGQKSNLVHWNTGENFPSLGIGRFIWYKKEQRGPFEESLPQLVRYYKSKNVRLPKILRENEYAPWSSREELILLKEVKDADIAELT